MPAIADIREDDSTTTIRRSQSLPNIALRPCTRYDGGEAVRTATFTRIKPENFGLESSELPLSIYDGDEALRMSHLYLKYHPASQDFHKKWQSKKFAYVTMLTDDKYLPGVIMLHYSVRVSERPDLEYPFIVLYTRSLSETAIAALRLTQDNDRHGMILRRIEPLLPAPHHNITVADPRFADTWTKLRVFQLFGKYTTMVYLDADMLVTHCDRPAPPMHTVFDYAKDLPQYCIAAVHDCTCSLGKYLGHMRHVRCANCVFHYQLEDDDEKTLIAQPGQSGPVTMFNSGMFIFHPNKRLWDAIEYYFDNSTMLGKFRFPDQDFLVTFFKYRWASIPFEWNAVKTMVYRHGELWADSNTKIIHYIVDKPWMKRTDRNDEVVGFCGRDTVLHAYWWSRFGNYQLQRERRFEFELLDVVNKFVADRDGKRQIDQ